VPSQTPTAMTVIAISSKGRAVLIMLRVMWLFGCEL
jgi:hypothetical protein